MPPSRATEAVWIGISSATNSWNVRRGAGLRGVEAWAVDGSGSVSVSGCGDGFGFEENIDAVREDGGFGQGRTSLFADTAFWLSS